MCVYLCFLREDERKPDVCPMLACLMEIDLIWPKTEKLY